MEGAFGLQKKEFLISGRRTAITTNMLVVFVGWPNHDLEKVRKE